MTEKLETINSVREKLGFSEISTAKPKFIILEGVDRSGKDSMQDEIDQATRYKHIITDRGPIGFLAYCEIFNKSDELFQQYWDMEMELKKLSDVLVIYLTAETETLVDRCIKTDHEILDFDYHKKVYETFVDSSSLPSIKVDTTHKHVKEIVQDLIKEGIL